MKTLWDESSRDELKKRLGLLQADTKPLWGGMNAPQMVAHLGSSMQMATGELKVAPKKLPIRFPPLKQLIIYWLPWPKGTPTAPELLTNEPAEWAEGIARLRRGIDRFGARKRDGAWPDHPAFGRMTHRSWGVLAYRHIDHHFRQFGV
ncbi:MAG TPA: DUF1569 domain-containing protein [Gemmatimonadaceae bacterium]|nr:DUF1569 domain-containing protein [Gemmatimonadaceae bacterium]